MILAMSFSILQHCCVRSSPSGFRHFQLESAWKICIRLYGRSPLPVRNNHPLKKLSFFVLCTVHHYHTPGIHWACTYVLRNCNSPCTIRVMSTIISVSKLEYACTLSVPIAILYTCNLFLLLCTACTRAQRSTQVEWSDYQVRTRVNAAKFTAVITLRGTLSPCGVSYWPDGLVSDCCFRMGSSPPWTIPYSASDFLWLISCLKVFEIVVRYGKVKPGQLCRTRTVVLCGALR